MSKPTDPLPMLVPSMLALPSVRSIFQAIPAWIAQLMGPPTATDEDFESGRWARGLMLSARCVWPLDPRVEWTTYSVEMQWIWEAACDDPARIRWESAAVP